MSPQDLPLPAEAWSTATEEELVAALMEPKRFVNPCFMAWQQRERPAAVRRYLLLFRDLGGTLGRPARALLEEEP